MKYLKGDATAIETGIIAHIVNDVGSWGKGFVVPLGQKFPQSKSQYKTKFKHFSLGDVQFVHVQSDPPIVVANMMAQKGIGKGERRVRYGSLRKCLLKVREFAISSDLPVHMPKIGAGLGGGDWNEIESIIKETLDGVKTTVWLF